MPSQDKMPCFFLGANAPKGYYSKFDQLFNYDPSGKCFLIKGGPGTGKSTLLKKVAAVLKEKGMDPELIYCTADTNSLDAVITSDGSFTILDATLPHAVEPKYAGAYETTVSLCDCWDEAVLKQNADKIIELFNKNREMHDRARRYIAAAANLFDEAARLSLDTISQEKVARTAMRVCAREFKKQRRGQGTEKIRFLSGITDKGIYMFDETANVLCDKIYVVEDNCGAASRIFMSTVRRIALDCGFNIITCRCSIFPTEKIEHIFIPELRLGFMTSNKRHPVAAMPYRVIHAKRFVDEKKLSKYKIRIRFTLRAATELLNEAVNCMKEAKAVHDELENLYIPAMDFSLVEKKLSEVLEAIE